MQNNPQVDNDKLTGIVHQLDTLSNQLHANHGQVAQSLRQNEFLASIRQRSTIPGGNCAFDLPATTTGCKNLHPSASNNCWNGLPSFL